MRKKMYLIANPFSGTGKIKSHLFKIVDVFSSGGYDITVHLTSSRGDATAQAAEIGPEYDTVVCCGGDGTLNEVITGLMQNENKFKLGYIPAGTLNEWSSGLKISRKIKKAAQDILKSDCVPLDIGKFGDRYFSYTASFGAFTKASYATSQKVKNTFGKVAYLLGGIKCLNDIHRIPLKVSCNDQEIEGDFIFGTVSNSLSVGGVVHYRENMVELGDGLFEVLLVKYPKNIIELKNAVSAVLRKDFTHESIIFLQASRVEFKEAAEVHWTLDGEHIEPKENIVIENLHSAINFLIPANKPKKKDKKEKEE